MTQRPISRLELAPPASRFRILGNACWADRRCLAITTIVAVLFMAVAGSSHAAQIEGIDFPKSVKAGEAEVPLFGLGLLRYRVLFRGYVGGLYLPTGARGGDVFNDVPKALELYYFWDIPGRFFGEAADELLAKNLPPERLAAIRERLDQLNRLYKDVEVGDRYRLTYQPGEGTTVQLNGKALGTIPGADFARDYFSIWLGENPLSEPFRDQILGGLR